MIQITYIKNVIQIFYIILSALLFQGLCFKKFIFQFFCYSIFFWVWWHGYGVAEANQFSGDAEVNQGPKIIFRECLSICRCNLNSISAHDYSNLFLLKAYTSVDKFDIICLSKTYLDCSVLFDDDNW